MPLLRVISTAKGFFCLSRKSYTKDSLSTPSGYWTPFSGMFIPMKTCLNAICSCTKNRVCSESISSGNLRKMPFYLSSHYSHRLSRAKRAVFSWYIRIPSQSYYYSRAKLSVYIKGGRIGGENEDLGYKIGYLWQIN